MKILSMELKGYKRLLLNNINYIKITPVNKIQLILGSNGSGKSSLIKELSPMPAIANEYEKDGYKIIQISHNNSIYILKSIFSHSGNKYYFIKDNEELNEGNTVTVYKDLVKSEFNITQEVHDIMIGFKSFHDMSSNERRNWFTRISNVDYSFALNYYNKLKEQLRDIQGAIKYNQVKLVQETNKILSSSEEIKMRTDLGILRDLLSNILNSKLSLPVNKTSSDINLLDINKQIKSLSASLLSKTKLVSKNTYMTMDDIDEKIKELETTITVLNVHVNNLYKSITKEQDTLDSLQKTNVDNINDLDNSINDLYEHSYKYTKSLNIFSNFEEPKQAYSALLTISGNLIEIFTNIQPNADKKFSRANHSLLLEEQKELNYKLSALNQNQDSLIIRRKELEHFKQHNKIECPECKHVWHQGYSDNDYKSILVSIENNLKVYEDIKRKIEINNSSINDSNEYINLYRTYINITKSWPVLDNLWNYLLNTSIIFDNPRKIVKILEDTKYDILTHIKIEETQAKINELIKLKNIFNDDKELSLTNIKVILAKQEIELEEYLSKIRDYASELSKVKIHKQIYKDIELLTVDLENNLTAKEKGITNTINLKKQEYLNKSIELIQLEITKNEIILSNVDVQKAIVNNISIQINDLTNKQDVLKIAMKELSPTEGLIAESLTGFINYFVFQVNSFIKKVWLYPLEIITILPDDSEELELDYKFSVKINNKITIKDIQLTSSAMKEIINLSFKLVSMQYLGLQESPVFLDELGSSFDKAHRGTVIQLIQNLVLSSNFTQLYIISHYEEMYASLQNTDVTILCSANIPDYKNNVFNSVSVIK